MARYFKIRLIRNTINDISNPQTLYHDKVELSLKMHIKSKHLIII